MNRRALAVIGGNEIETTISVEISRLKLSEIAPMMETTRCGPDLLKISFASVRQDHTQSGIHATGFTLRIVKILPEREVNFSISIKIAGRN